MEELNGIKYVTAAEGAELLGNGVTQGLIHTWARRRHLVAVGRLKKSNLYRWSALVEVEAKARASRTGRPRGTSPDALPTLTNLRESATMSANMQSDHAAQRAAERSAGIPALARSVVYYMRFVDRVKIGYSQNFLQRMRSIPHDEVLALEPGGYDLEQQRHRQFACYRVSRHNEWFELSELILGHVRSLVRDHGTPAEIMRKPPPIPPSHRHLRGGA